MFNWFAPKCPVDAVEQAWIEKRMTWLTEQFGIERLRAVRVVLPISEFFPEPYDGKEAAIRTLLNRVCVYMQIPPERVDVQFYKQKPDHLIDPDNPGTAGVYAGGEQKSRIGIEVSTLKDPISLIATMAHELAHVHLLGDKRISGQEDDHEPLTDLTTVFFGLGIFNANATVRFAQWTYGNWQGYGIRGSGYLTEEAFGYALAWFARARGETKPRWAKCLNTNVRSSFKQATRYFKLEQSRGGN